MAQEARLLRSCRSLHFVNKALTEIADASMIHSGEN